MSTPLAQLRARFDTGFTDLLESISRDEFAALLDTAECAAAFLKTPCTNFDVSEDEFEAVTNLHLAAYPLLNEPDEETPE
jgi:hypothetical protein